jgi:hypothetical protein
LVKSHVEDYAKIRQRSWFHDDRILRKDAEPVIGRKRIGDVTRQDIRNILSPIVERDPLTENPAAGMKKPAHKPRACRRMGYGRDRVCGAPTKGAAVTYFVRHRIVEGRQRWHVIGRQGSPRPPETARDKTLELLGEVVKGTDPASKKRAGGKATTVAGFCDLYLSDAEAGRLLIRRNIAKMASTPTLDRGRVDGPPPLNR